jgi:hypothetical protein
MSRDDEDLAPVIKLDEAFVRAAQFKEPRADDRGGRARRPRSSGLWPRSRSTRARRLRQWLPGLAVLVVGAYVLDLPVPFLTEDDARPAQQTAPLIASDNATTTTTDFRLLNVSYRAGDCVTWDQERQADRTTVAVPCDQPHLMEITGWVDLSGLDKYPSEAEWKSIKRARECPEQAERYLGYPLDPFGRFQANGIIPVSDTWSRGDKGVWCSLLLTPLAADNDPSRHDLFTRSAKGSDQTKLWGVGSCLAIDGDAIDGIVDCSAPHALEVVGSVDVRTRWAEVSTGSDGWNRVLPDCSATARRYFNGRVPAGVGIDVLPFQPQSWAAGRHRAECVALRNDPAGKPTALTAPLRGS